MKKSIVSIISVGLLFSTIASVQSIQPTIANAKITKAEFSNKGWHKGTPKMFHSGGHIWISTPKYTSEAKGIGAAYEQEVTKLSANHGFDMYPLYFKANHQYKTTGADTSVFAGLNPHYRKINDKTYQITSGVIKSKHSLHDEIYNTNSMVGTTNLVKVINNNQIQTWTYEKIHGKLKLIDEETMYRYDKLPKNFYIYQFN